MDKRALITVIIFLLIAVLGVIIWQKSQIKTTASPSQSVTQIKKVDLSTQPLWVQKLVVTAKKGRSANGLDNFTLSVTGIQADSLTYVLQYQTANKGAQGVLSMTPQKVVSNAFIKIIDLGTCSTKSCVRHDGVTAIDVELDFSDSSVWTGSVNLK